MELLCLDKYVLYIVLCMCSRPKTVPEEMKIGEEESTEAQTEDNGQPVSEALTSSSQVRKDLFGRW